MPKIKRKYYQVTYPRDKKPPFAEFFQLQGKPETISWRWTNSRTYIICIPETYKNKAGPNGGFSSRDAEWKEIGEDEYGEEENLQGNLPK